MKKLLIPILASFFLAGAFALAAPLYTPLRSVIPEVDQQYYVGTTTPSNLRYSGNFYDLRIDGTCIGCLSALTFTYPLVDTADVISLAFGTTTANQWSALQEFNGNDSTTALTVSGNTYLT